MTDGFEFGDADLLEGIAPPLQVGITQETQRTLRSRHAHEAWKAWAKETGRPDAREPARRFLSTYQSQLEQGRTHEYLLDVVRGAARLPVGLGSTGDDTRRVINALKSIPIGRTAVSALRSDEPAIPYPHGDTAELKSSIADVVEACRVPASEWGSRDQEAAGLLVESYTADELEEAAVKASRAMGLEGILPTDLIRAARSTAVTARTTATPARETYSAGVAERDRVKGVDFSVDDLANRMLAEGHSAEAIVAIHNMAPEGYWDEVFQLAIEGYANEEAYRRLRQDFDDWHPDDRKS